MCFGGGKSDGSGAQIAAQQKADEEARQARINEGRSRIDSSFAQYDDPYFAKFRTDFVGAQTPDIDEQYSVAKDRLAAALANRGVLSSTIAGNAFGDLTKTNTKARTDLSNQAFDASNQFHNSIEKTKSDLYNTNIAAADPGLAANRAEGEAASLVAPRPSPLGDIFASVLAPFASYQRGSMYSPYGNPKTAGLFSFAPTTGAGSGKVIG